MCLTTSAIKYFNWFYFASISNLFITDLWNLVHSEHYTLYMFKNGIMNVVTQSVRCEIKLSLHTILYHQWW